MALRAWLCVAATLAMPVDEDLPCAWVRSSTSDRCVAPPMARRTCSVTLAQCEARYAPLLARIARDLAPWEATGITDAMVAARVARRSAVGDDLWLGARNGTLAVARVKPKGYKGRGHKAYAHLKQALETLMQYQLLRIKTAVLKPCRFKASHLHKMPNRHPSADLYSFA